MKKRKVKHHKTEQPDHPVQAAVSAAAAPASTSTPRAALQKKSAAPASVEPAALLTNDAEPTVRRGAPMPVLMIALLGILFYVGDIYLLGSSGQFDGRVYHPYKTVKELEDLQPKSESEEQYAQGRKVYAYICVQCHQENGRGNPTAFIPPLAGSDWVLASEPGRLIRIVSKGLNGPIKVSGQEFGLGAMLAAGDQLPGDEEAKVKQIAAVITYIRNTWGNKASPVTVERVRAVRAKIKDRTEAWTAEELLKIPENE